MPSIGTYIAQNPTRTFVVTQDNNNGENGAYCFSQADVDSWYEADKARIVKVSKSLLIIPGTASGYTLYDVLMGNNGAPADLNYSTIIQDRKSLIDMGKEIVIGNAQESRLLVLRYVKSYCNAATGQDAVFGYVVVENNTTELAPNNAGRFTVRVARI